MRAAAPATASDLAGADYCTARRPTSSPQGESAASIAPRSAGWRRLAPAADRGAGQSPQNPSRGHIGADRPPIRHQIVADLSHLVGLLIRPTKCGCTLGGMWQTC